MADSNVTKRALATAMKQLMAAEPFSKISVGDICQVCQMNRKSFYYHFRDKYDLVNWIFQTEFLTAVQRRPYESTWALIGDLCEYFYENRAFYHNALSVEGQNSFQDYFREILAPVMRAYAEDLFEVFPFLVHPDASEHVPIQSGSFRKAAKGIGQIGV